MPFMPAAGQQGGSSAGSLLILLLPLVLIGLMIWSQRRRAKQMQQVQRELRVGQEVATTSGLMGQIVELDDSIAHLMVADGVVVRFDRRAVVPASVVTTGQVGSTPAAGAVAARISVRGGSASVAVVEPAPTATEGDLWADGTMWKLTLDELAGFRAVVASGAPVLQITYLGIVVA